MNARDLRLDYFKIYDVSNHLAGYRVALQGQFDKFADKVELMALSMFANPVSKNGERLYDRHAHLTYYSLHQQVIEPTRAVVFENQFGKQKILIGHAHKLMVPAEKYGRGSEFPKELDHYKVYAVLKGRHVEQRVKLKDQFGSQEVEVADPFAFAVPVKKIHHGETFGIHNERAHLVIYRMTPGSVDQTKLVRDQFGRRYLRILRSVLLGTPSLKLEWREVSGDR